MWVHHCDPCLSLHTAFPSACLCLSSPLTRTPVIGCGAALTQEGLISSSLLHYIGTDPESKYIHLRRFQADISFGGRNSTHCKHRGPSVQHRTSKQSLPRCYLQSQGPRVRVSWGRGGDNASGGGSSVGKGQAQDWGAGGSPCPLVTVSWARLPGSASAPLPAGGCSPGCGAGRPWALQPGAGPGRGAERGHLLWARGPGKPAAGASPAPEAQPGRAKVSRAGAEAGPGPPQHGPACGPTPRALQKCPFVGRTKQL